MPNPRKMGLPEAKDKTAPLTKTNEESLPQAAVTERPVCRTNDSLVESIDTEQTGMMSDLEPSVSSLASAEVLKLSIGCRPRGGM